MRRPGCGDAGSRAYRERDETIRSTLRGTLSMCRTPRSSRLASLLESSLATRTRVDITARCVSGVCARGGSAFSFPPAVPRALGGLHREKNVSDRSRPQPVLEHRRAPRTGAPREYLRSAMPRTASASRRAGRPPCLQTSLRSRSRMAVLAAFEHRACIIPPQAPAAMRRCTPWPLMTPHARYFSTVLPQSCARPASLFAGQSRGANSRLDATRYSSVTVIQRYSSRTCGTRIGQGYSTALQRCSRYSSVTAALQQRQSSVTAAN